VSHVRLTTFFLSPGRSDRPQGWAGRTDALSALLLASMLRAGNLSRKGFRRTHQEGAWQ
jgi:hypothetical protein